MELKILGKKAAIENAVSLAGKRAAAGFFKFHEAMESAGFGLARVPFQKGLAVYDRALDADGIPNGKSCYSVFVWVGKESLKIRFQNPDYSERAALLQPSEISILKIEAVFSSSSIGKIIAEIKRNSSKKPQYAFFLALHDHIRFVNGDDLAALHIDDGMSDAAAMIMHKKGENIDFDFGSSCHNHFSPKHMEFVREIEEAIGISKGASIELTMPFARESTNGPHHLLWFANFEAASEYQSRLLSSRVYKYPAYAPSTPPEVLKAENQKLRAEGLLAVGIAHPASGLKLPIFGVPPVGLLDVVANGDYPLDFAFDYVASYIDSVACFNCLASKEIRQFANPSEGKRMLELVQKWGFGDGLYPNAINMAFAYEMKKRYGKSIHVDNDIHNFHLFSFKHTIHGYGKAKTILLATNGTGKPSPAEVVRMLGSKRESFLPFVPYSKSEMDLVPARRNETFIQKAEGFAAKAWFHLTNTLPAVYQDAKTRIVGLFH